MCPWGESALTQPADWTPRTAESDGRTLSSSTWRMQIRVDFPPQEETSGVKAYF